jgi:hypothetical protein
MEKVLFVADLRLFVVSSSRMSDVINARFYRQFHLSESGDYESKGRKYMWVGLVLMPMGSDETECKRV